jgi:hypothetical protein
VLQLSRSGRYGGSNIAHCSVDYVIRKLIVSFVGSSSHGNESKPARFFSQIIIHSALVFLEEEHCSMTP